MPAAGARETAYNSQLQSLNGFKFQRRSFLAFICFSSPSAMIYDSPNDLARSTTEMAVYQTAW